MEGFGVGGGDTNKPVWEGMGCIEVSYVWLGEGAGIGSHCVAKDPLLFQ